MSQKPLNEIVICMGSSCFARGNKQTLAIVKKYLKDRSLEEDVVFRGTHCTNICDQGPALIINGQIITKLMPEDVADVLDEYLENEK